MSPASRIGSCPSLGTHQHRYWTLAAADSRCHPGPWSPPSRRQRLTSMSCRVAATTSRRAATPSLASPQQLGDVSRDSFLQQGGFGVELLQLLVQLLQTSAEVNAIVLRSGN